MKIRTLKLARFRNLEDLEIEPNGALNILFGPNGSGKTNLCEAIHFVSAGKNLKGRRQTELIHWDSDDSLIKLTTAEDDQIIVYLKRGESKQIRYNSKEKKQSQLRRMIPTFTFTPEDLNLSQGSPQRRRSMLNDQLSLMDDDYDGFLNKYESELKKKNNLLKKNKINEQFLNVLNERIVELGAEMAVRRTSYLNELNEILPGVYQEFASNDHKLTLNYGDKRYVTTDLDRVKEIFAEEIEDSSDREVELETSVVGPHRDKFVYRLNDRDLRKYGSQGEQRTAVVATYFANLRLYRDAFGEPPVLIFDDILSELDRSRGNALLENLPEEPQIFMTTATRNQSFKKLSGEFSAYQLDAGQIEKLR